MTAEASSLAAQLRTAPLPTDGAAAESRVADWLRSLHPDSPMHAHAALLPVRRVLAAMADHSPFLWHLVTADPERCAALLSQKPDTALSGELEALDRPAWDHGTEAAALMAALRRARQAVALLVAVADLGGAWTLDQVTVALTRFADTAVRVAIRALLREAERTGKLLPSVGSVDLDCGLAVLALGKQGAVELNYSSDIDLVVLFDPDAARLPPGAVPSKFFVRLTQQFVRLLQERTADGYVLRVDLRLRPDPASTAVAIGLPSAYSYYERYGQNWERAAFIKARPVAGDRELAWRFLDELAPFIWRKYFDYAAIADVHAMKRQIHAVRGGAEVAVAGHDVKLGRGGIREIEFFAQTQQLIFGGRRPELRGRRTLATLAALRDDGWIDEAAVADLSEAYRFLRTVEHRLQMVADAQTQRLPESDGDLARFARFAGFADRADFAEALTQRLRRVEAHYARLFEHAPGLDTALGSLVFTGTGADPETLETLRSLGFTRPSDAVEIIRGWHFGRRPAVQSPRAREVLTELTPALLDAFAGSSDPDAALAALDTMLGRSLASVELFSLLRSNPALRDLFADILGSAPRLAATVAARPHVLDAAIDPATLRAAEAPEQLTARVRQVLGAVRTIEEFLDRARDLAQEEAFLIGVRLLSGALDTARAGQAYSRLAELIVSATFARCLADFTLEHGRVPGGACVVLALGKLGSREMTATSDLDLMVIYRFEPEAGASDGARALDGARYYTRLTQRLIAALTAPTRRGRLYDVDVRLRPSGRQGPLAVQLGAFVHYQAQEAQTWEHMALTRARVVAGDPALAADVESTIGATLGAARDPVVLQADVRTMRALVETEKGGADFWDMKLAAGGLLDIDFAAQFLLLRFAPTHPGLLGEGAGRAARAIPGGPAGDVWSQVAQAPVRIIAETARLGLLAIDDGEVLARAYRLQTALTQLTRLTVEGRFDPAKAGAGVLRRLCAAANQPDLPALQSELADLRVAVRAILRRMLDWQ